MSNFKEEYEARLRRVCGVTDDSRHVEVVMDMGGAWEGCDTCGYGADEAHLEIVVDGTETAAGAYREFTGSGAFGDLMRELEAVEL